MYETDVIKTMETIGRVKKVLIEKVTVEKTKITGIRAQKTGYKAGKTFPAPEEMRGFSDGDRWAGEKDAHCWFYFTLDVPEPKENERYELRIYTDHDTKNPQFIVYGDGIALRGADNEHNGVPIKSGKSREFFVYAYGGATVAEYFTFEPYLLRKNTDAEKLVYDIDYPLKWLKITQPKSSAFYRCLDVLSRTVNMLCLSFGDARLYESVADAAKYLEREFYVKIDCAAPTESVTCVGHSHIDVAWLWTLEQTAEKVQHTAATVLALLEGYPEFRYMATQPLLYRFLMEQDSELYGRLKKAVADGRWEPEGGMWVEPDCNMPSGESLVRQIMYGKEFFTEQFGADCEICWLPDSFGFSAALPQILKKSGYKYFVTSKLSWGDTNQMPHDLFMWRGIDGSEIPAYFLTTQNYPEDGNAYNHTAYSGNLNPSQVKGAYNRFSDKELTDSILMPFGYGDGGGGPSVSHLETGRRMAKNMPGIPSVRMATAKEFFTELESKTDAAAFPVWNGELYLEFHRGIFTSVSEIKKRNRKSEFALQNAETLGVICERLLGMNYPSERFKENYLKLLVNQFHDIVSGTAIRPVNCRALSDYADILSEVGKISEEYINAICAAVKGKGRAVFNFNSFTADSTALTDDGYRFFKNIPAKGYALIEPEPLNGSVKIGESTLENEYLKVTFDGEYNVTGLYDKRAERETVKRGKILNRLSVYEDKPCEFAAWEIKRNIYEKEYPLRFEYKKEFVEGCRSGFEIRKSIGGSRITQKISLSENEAILRFDTVIDWADENLTLKAHFPLDVNAECAVNDVQFGYVKRELHENTSWEKARYEVCMHKYADISEGGYGVALLNDGRYGYGIVDREINLTLLKSSTYPDESADKGRHTISYALYAHDCGFENSDVHKAAYLFNNPLLAVTKGENGKGILPERFSFVSCDKDNVIVETVKKCEKDGAYVLRLYETKNRRTEIKLKTEWRPRVAQLCDLLENVTEEARILSDGIKLTVRPFEIVTLKISF